MVPHRTPAAKQETTRRTVAVVNILTTVSETAFCAASFSGVGCSLVSCANYTWPNTGSTAATTDHTCIMLVSFSSPPVFRNIPVSGEKHNSIVSCMNQRIWLVMCDKSDHSVKCFMDINMKSSYWRPVKCPLICSRASWMAALVL